MNRSTVMLIAGVVVGAVLGWYLRRFTDIDGCLDHGGPWDYEELRCEGESRR